MRRIAPTLVLALALAALAACGGDDAVSAEEFQEQVRQAQETVQDEVGSLRDVDSPEDLEQRADEAANAIREQADELEGLEPPEEAREAQDSFVSGLRELADRLDEESENLGEEDVREFVDGLEGLGREDLDRALDELRDAGIEIPSLD